MSDLKPDSRQLWKQARRDFEPTARDAARIDHALARRLGIAVGALVSAPRTASANAGAASGATSAGASALVGVAKWLAGVALVGAALVSGYRATRTAPAELAPVEVPTRTVAHGVDPAPRPAAEGTSTAWREVPTDESIPAKHEAEPLPVPTSAPTPSPRPQPETTRKHAGALVGEEARLVRGADEALRAGDAVRALALLDEHARNFKDGILAEERAAVRVAALCKLGRVGEAREEAARFLTASPDSHLAEGVRASCGGQ